MTPISAKHLSIPFETVSIAVIIAPIMTGTIVTLRNFQIRFNSRLRPVLLLLIIIIIYDRNSRPLASQCYKLDQYIMREGTKKLFVFHADEIRSEDGSTSTTSAANSG